MSRIRANTITNQNANGAPNFPNGITVTGVVTATTTSQNITGDLTVSGNLGVGGTVTYEDVKHVDSVGVITARDGLRVTGIATISGDVSIADKIIHTGDTDTAIRFSAADTVSIETAGNEQARFNHTTGTVLYNHIVPNNDSTKDIGLTGTRFRNAYVDNYYGSGANLTGIEGGKVRNYKHVVDTGYAAGTWSSFTQIASFSYTPLQTDSKIIVFASLNFLWENSNLHNARMKFGSNSYVQYNKVAKAASVSGWFSGNPCVIYDLGTSGNTSSNSVILEAQGNGSHTSYFNYSSAHSMFMLLEMAPAG